MTTHHARVQRKPFLTPIWLIAVGALAVAAFLGFDAWLWVTADSTTVVVIRHADKAQDAGDDPPLNPAGELRAAQLARLFGDPAAPGHIDAIYVSPTRRSRMTAAPLAARLGLTPIEAPQHDPDLLARRALRENSGRRVLIVAHGDTLTEVVHALTGAQGLPAVGPDEYGSIYIVSVPRIGRADFLRLTY